MCCRKSHSPSVASNEKESPVPSDPTKKPPSKAVSEPEQLEDQIRERAYELYESRDREDGHDLEDWLRAEEEIAREKVRSIAA